MKILYIAQDDCAAQVAERALSRIAPTVELSWASTPAAALEWIRDNRDAQAVIAETGREDPAFDDLLEQIRGLGATMPVAAIAPEHLEALAAALEAHLEASRQAHETALARTNSICIALQERLLELEAELHRAEERHATQTVAAEQLIRREAELSAALAQAVAFRATLERELADAADARQIAQQRSAEELAAAGGRCTLLETRLAQEITQRTAAEERLAAADVARADAERKHETELAAFAARLADREAQHDAALTRTTRICTSLQQRLLDLEAAAHQAGAQHAEQIAFLSARLEETQARLREAQRLEAVGRVASEVATTCDTLLRDVSQTGRQWLSALESDTPLRQQGELLMGDVTRAAGFLRRFAVYGQQQISNAASVSLARALYEIAPILKRVLGPDIVLLLPKKTTSPFDVDVDGERVERILVNVANYARERMPQGGRVKIELAMTVVDGEFVASHPEVRPGEHVVLTISEIHGPVWPALRIPLPISRPAQPRVPRSASDAPAMDVGPLVALIDDAGGHLWMSAEPAGNMTLRIHLPKRRHAELLTPAAAASSSNRRRPVSSWFR